MAVKSAAQQKFLAIKAKSAPTSAPLNAGSSLNASASLSLAAKPKKRSALNAQFPPKV